MVMGPSNNGYGPPTFVLILTSSSSWPNRAASRPGGNRCRPQLSFAVDNGSLPHYFSAIPRRQPTLVSRNYHTIAAATAMPRRSLSASSNDNNGEQFAEYDDDDDVANGLYLDPETYLQAEDTILRSDGSLDLVASRQGSQRPTAKTPPLALGDKKNAYQKVVEGLFSPPPSYSYYSDTNNDDAGNGIDDGAQISQSLSDDERLYQAVLEIENGRSRGGGVNADQVLLDPESLHQQVFAEEQAYLQQSEDFRNALSSLFTDNTESPMAKERRECIEQYNESVLSNLMKDMDEMEDMALSREDAIMRSAERANEGIHQSTFASNNDTRLGKSAVSCSMCGLRVTPDMIQRATMINQLAKDSRDILCTACHGQRFVRKEAELRVPASEFASSRMFDKKSTRLLSKNEFCNSARSWNTDRRGDGKDRGDSSIQGISTTSLFDVSSSKQSSQRVVENDDAALKHTPIINTISRISSSSSTPIAADTSSSDYHQQRLHRRSSSRVLGGAQLMKRMQRRESESSQGGEEEQIIPGGSAKGRLFMANRGMDQLRKENVNDEVDSFSSDDENGRKIIHSIVADNNDQRTVHSGAINHWVNVEDPNTKRSFFWNRETGEMKKS
jgi:hypothetical protein